MDVEGPLPAMAVCDRRTVYLMLDSNIDTNSKVQAASDALVRELVRRGCTVRWCHLPEEPGIDGPDDYIGVRGLAALHNDGLLILDELSQTDAQEACEAAYLLANGWGKARASSMGTARQSASWRLLFLSAGEESLSVFMARAGKKPTAGQEIRLAEIAANAGAGLGAFEELHGCANGAALALAVKDAASRYHGAVGAEWLRLVVRDRDKLGTVLTNGIRKFVAEFAPKGATGQVERVARRFALVAAAGEIATQYGLTGWKKGESSTAVGRCFASWLESTGGTGNRAERALPAQVRGYSETHGASRFQKVSGDSRKGSEPALESEKEVGSSELGTYLAHFSCKHEFGIQSV